MTPTIAGEILRKALERARMTQAELARRVYVDPGQVSRWCTGRTPLRGRYARAVATVLADHGVEIPLAPTTRVFLSTPMAALGAEGYERQRADATAVYELLTRAAGPVYWPAGAIDSAARFEAPDIATERNLAALAEAEAFVLYQSAPVDRPSSCYVELGWAIASRKPVTVFASSEEDLPYMLRGFEVVAARRDGRYRFHLAADAMRLLKIHGAELLGIDQAVAA